MTQELPKLLYSREKMGFGATVELDNGEVVVVSIAQTGVLVRNQHNKRGFIKSILADFFGPTLYKEAVVYKNTQTALALKLTYPEQVSALSFKNPVLAAFSNAIWHCSSSAEVSVILNEAGAKAPRIEEMATLYEAFNAARNWPLKLPPEKSPPTYRVVYSDGMTRECHARLMTAEEAQKAFELAAFIVNPYIGTLKQPLRLRADVALIEFGDFASW